MDDTEKYLFHFLRIGLGFGGAEQDVDVSGCDWNALFSLSLRQAVQGVVADGIAASGLRPPPGLWHEWVAHLLHLEMINDEMARQGKWLLGLLAANCIEASVFKGTSVAAWYPHPLHRCYGDIDIVVHSGWDKLCQVLQDNGLTYFYESGDIIVEQLYDASRAALCDEWRPRYAGRRFRVEFHPAYETLYNPFMNARLKRTSADMAGRMRGGVKALSVADGGTEFYLACLILHLRRHVLSYGIGLKQVCDVAVMLRRAGVDMALLEQMLRHFGAWRFSRALFRFIEAYLFGGVSSQCRGDKATALLYDIFIGDGYVLKAERESKGNRTRFSPVRIAGNGLFWAKRSLHLFRLMPGESFFFMFSKAVKRLGIRVENEG